ncbi:MAG TPA: polyphosphate:AMP phosphotransferase [Vicinamibacterales bacterium]|nr:polyphosphate:AMP phosphotransferase [Vicinamibacterales bacterium]
MFEAAELDRSVAKADYDFEVSKLRWQLLDAQRTLERRPFPLIVLFGGVDGAGKSETVHLLNEWMDPRWIVNRAFEAPSEDERERPPFWRFWLALPPRGRIGLFLSAWYSEPLLDRVHRRTTPAEFDAALDRIASFERTLADDGAVFVKFWMHLDRKAQKKQLRSLSRDPLTRWRVTRTQWKQWKLYDRFVAAAERMIQRTSFGHAPWIIVDASDPRYRSLVAGTEIQRALTRAFERHDRASELARTRAAAATPTSQTPALVDRVRRDRSVLDALDMKRTLSKRLFDKRLLKQQGRLHLLQRKAQEARRSIVFVFEGWDAAGKGGAIRRVTSALDPRSYRVIPVAAPTDEERARHYLWRFWRHLSRAGRVTIYDRSWYGRVLVERVDGFASEAEWSRAYAEIEEFERELVGSGIVLLKYWLHITKAEQEKRFRERASSPYKSWKLTEEDWRNREKWDAYELAVNDMVARTSTRRAPWHLIPANDKNYARVEVLRRAANAIERAL